MNDHSSAPHLALKSEVDPCKILKSLSSIIKQAIYTSFLVQRSLRNPKILTSHTCSHASLNSRDSCHFPILDMMIIPIALFIPIPTTSITTPLCSCSFSEVTTNTSWEFIGQKNTAVNLFTRCASAKCRSC